MKNLVFEFSPLMAILLVLSVVMPVGFTVSSATPAMATVDNCFISSPTTSAPAYISTLSGVATVPVTLNVNATAATSGDIELNVYSSGTTNLVYSQVISNIPLSAGLNVLSGYHAQVPMLTAAGYYDIVGVARQPVTSGNWIYSSCNCTTNIALSASNPGYRAIVVKNTAPTAPSLISPATGTITKISSVFLSWSCVTDPTGISYDYQYSTDPTFSGTTVNYVTTCNTTLSVAPDGTYYWRVRSKDGALNTSAYTSAWAFTVDTVPPTSAPTPTAPTNHGTLSGSFNPTLTWSASTDPSPSSGLRYWVQVCSNSGFTGTLSENITTITNTSYQPGAALSAGPWYWRVKARDLAWNESDWSATWDFTKPTIPGSYVQPLGTGWSLYSLPLCPSGSASMTPAQLLAACDNTTAVQIIWGYDCSSGWQYYIPGSSTSLTISVTKGYWIQTSSPVNITITGTPCPAPPQSLITATLCPGWNLVGFKSCSPILASTYFGSCSAGISYICNYASGWNCGATGAITMQPGQGYWVYHGGTTNCSYGLPCN